MASGQAPHSTSQCLSPVVSISPSRVHNGAHVCVYYQRGNCMFGSKCKNSHPGQPTKVTTDFLSPIAGVYGTPNLAASNPSREASEDREKSRAGLPHGFWDGVARETKKVLEAPPLEPVQFDTPTVLRASKRSHGEMAGGPDTTCGTDHDELDRNKIKSLFHHDRLEAVKPSLVHPTTPLEAQNNILYVSAIGKQYQIDIKDANIRTRDNQIRAKDHQIAELTSLVELRDIQIANASASNHGLRVAMLGKERELAGLSSGIMDQKLYIAKQDQRIQQMSTSLKQHKPEIRMLYSELKSKKAEIASLQKQQAVNWTLQWLQGCLDQPSRKTSAVTFPLMQIAGEVRNRIYRCALVTRRPIDFWPIVSYESDTAFDHAGVDHTTVLFEQLKEINVNLLLVSRQVYNETVGILYGCNRFRFSDRGGWIVLHGWLTHINLNSRFLTNVSVAYPKCISTELISESQPFAARHPRELEEMRIIVRRFGGAILDSPAGPSTHRFLSFKRARDMLWSLENLKSISIVLPHNVHIMAPWAERAVKTLSPHDDIGPFVTASPRPDGDGLTRSFIFIRRHYFTMARKSLQYDLDDDALMGRSHVVALCQLHGAKVKTASYGGPSDGVSYTADDGEDDYDVDVPDYIESPGGIGGVLKPLEVAKRLLGYK